MGIDPAIASNKAVDPDIEELLRQSAARATDAYWLGRADERIELQNARLTGIMDKLAQPAEAFYLSLQKIVPSGGIVQHRVGIDYSTGDPTVLAVISQKYAGMLREIREVARELELYLFREFGWEYNFWTTTDDKLERSLVEQDFPFFRREV
jgi:hypothetical protein